MERKNHSITLKEQLHQQFSKQWDQLEPLFWMVGAVLVLSVVIPKRKKARGARAMGWKVKGEPRFSSAVPRDPVFTKRGSSEEPSIKAKAILGFEERGFFKTLKEALPNHHILAQVSFNALLTHAPHLWGEVKSRVRGQFNRNFVDFVVCDPVTLEVMAIVEYDGSGHRYDKDARRDAMLEKAGYRVERFGVGYTLDSVRNVMGSFLNTQAPIRESRWVGEETTQF